MSERERFEAWFKDHRYSDVSLAYGAAWEAWQAAKADAVPELTDKMIVAIEQTVENQLQASGINADPFRLDGEKIWYAAIEAGENK